MIYSYRSYFKTSKSLISELYIYWDVTFVDGGGGDCKKAGSYKCDVGKKKTYFRQIEGAVEDCWRSSLITHSLDVLEGSYKTLFVVVHNLDQYLGVFVPKLRSHRHNARHSVTQTRDKKGGGGFSSRA